MKFNDIVIQNELRPCKVTGITRKALWHKWVDVREIVPPSLLNGGHGGGVIADTFGLIEFDDGFTKLISVGKIRFLDSRHKFDSFDFTEEEG